jgi:ATP-dependent helicase/nuclease subunit A
VIVENEKRLAEREELNLLYVAMTRAQQAFIVSGSEIRNRKPSVWYEKVRTATLSGAPVDPAAAAVHGDDLSAGVAERERETPVETTPAAVDPRLNAPLPTGERRVALSGRGLTYGMHFHALMERLTGAAPPARAALQRALGLADREFAPMWDQAQRVITSPALARFFDSRQFRRALNEVSYTTEAGEVLRIDRLVELDDAIWVLDYKTGEADTADPLLIEQYRVQVSGYRDAIGLAYPGRRVKAAVVFTDGNVLTLDD